jgi:hypothetical protein
MKAILMACLPLAILWTAAFGNSGSGTRNGIDKLFFEGYLIKVIPLGKEGYGYRIYYQQRLVVSHMNNPFTMDPTGLSRKEDAFKVAEWQIFQMRQRPNHGWTGRQMLSMDVARKLQVRLHVIQNQ